VLTSYLDGDLLLDIKEEAEAELRDNLAGLKPEEAAVLSLLEARIGRELEKAGMERDQPKVTRTAA
jgi:DNA topoisomerase-1